MSAPAASHDLRCPQAGADGPDVPCTCRNGGDVLRLPAGRPRTCLMCGDLPTWQVGTDARACDRCLSAVLTDFYATTYDGFGPCVVAPIRTPGVTR